MTIARHISVGFAFTALALAGGCAGNDGATTEGVGSERDGIGAPGTKSGATKLLPCDELPAGSKAKCVPASDGTTTGTPTAHVVGDVTTVPTTCRLYDGVGGTWLPTTGAQGLGSPLSDRFCELVWMSNAGSQPDWATLAAGYPGVHFSADPSCTDTVCSNASALIVSLANEGGGTGGATCNACLEGTLVGRAVNGTLYVTLPANWVQSSPTSLHVYRPWGVHSAYFTDYVVAFPAYGQSMRIATGTSANGPLYMEAPTALGGGT